MCDQNGEARARTVPPDIWQPGKGRPYRNPDPTGQEGHGRTNGKNKPHGPWWAMTPLRLLPRLRA